MLHRLRSHAPFMLSIARVVIALTYLEHGTQKLLGFPPSPRGGLHPALFSLFGAAGVIEIVGGGLIVLGLFTRWAAFICAGEMAVAFWLVHYRHGGIYPILNGGDAAVLFCFFFLYLVFAGPGPLSLDALRRRV